MKKKHLGFCWFIYILTHRFVLFHNMPCSLRLNLNREPDCVIEKADMLQR